MNLRDLRYLVALAETKHFGRAAEACHVSQPTLSAQLKKLEEQLGVLLFERSHKKVEITPTGAAILEHARLALEQADTIVKLARHARDPLAGPLRLGVIPTLGPYLLPLILAPLAKRFPQLALVLTEETTDRLLAGLAAHELDAALLATPLPSPELEAIPLFDEPFWLAYPRGDVLGELETVTDAALARSRLLLLADGHCLRDQALAVCSRDGPAAPSDADNGAMGDLRASSLETILHMVGAGFGCTLVPALAVRGGWTTDMGIQTRALELPSARRRVSLAFRTSFPRRPALEALAGVILDRLPNTVRPLSQGRAA